MPRNININRSLSNPEDGEQLTSPRKRMRMSFKTWAFLVLALLVAAGIFCSWYFYKKYTALKNNPNIEVQKQTASIVAKVGKLMELPKDDTPTIATISDKEKLKDQAFFNAADNGDILLAYTVAKQAILYRPSTNKIINVAPIYINQPEGAVQSGAQTNAAGEPLIVAYYNGTATPGLSTLAEKVVAERYPDVENITPTNAARKDYKTTLVVDISGVHSKEAEELASLLGGKVSKLPEGESVPNADILIISGK